MNRDDVIRMAREAGLAVNPPSWGYTESYHFAGFEQQVERFATLVAKAAIQDDLLWQAETETAVLFEREACEQACWDAETNDWEGRKACIDAIRARGNK